MRNIFIIHGTYGNPGENWFPWLKEELEQLGNRVIVPQFPCPVYDPLDHAPHDLDKWFETFEPYKGMLNNDSIIVAHSRGCVFTFHLLERIKQPINSAFLVGPFLYHWMRKDWTADDTGVRYPFRWDIMRNNAHHRIVYQSTNDEIPVEEGREIASNLDAEFVLVKNAGHFNVARDPKFEKFDLLLEHIKKIL